MTATQTRPQKDSRAISLRPHPSPSGTNRAAVKRKSKVRPLFDGPFLTAKTAGETAATIRAARGGALRRLAAWIGWNEGLLTLRSIAASLRLRSEGHVSHLIAGCERELSMDRSVLSRLDGALAILRA